MTKIFPLLLAALAGSVIASPAAPVVTQAPSLDKRAGATCTFTGTAGAASASAQQKNCATIVLSNVAVPSGTTLDLSDLNDNTHVRNHASPHLRLLLTCSLSSGHLQGNYHLGLQRMGRSSPPNRRNERHR